MEVILPTFFLQLQRHKLLFKNSLSCRSLRAGRTRWKDTYIFLIPYFFTLINQQLDARWGQTASSLILYGCWWQFFFLIIETFSSIQMFHLLPVHQNELKRMYFFVCGDFLPLDSIFVFIYEQFGRVMEYIIPQTPLFHGLLASAVGCNNHRWIT